MLSPLCRSVVGAQAPEKQVERPVVPPPRAPPAEQPQLPPQPPKLPTPQRAKRNFFSVLGGKLIDTSDDVLMHLRRSWMPSPDQKRTGENLKLEDGRLVYRSNRPVVLVLGSGWAAHSFMKVADIDKFDVVVCSPRNHFVFTPMLAGSAVGSVEFRSLLEPVRIANPHVSYFEATADHIDLGAKVARCKSSAAGDAQQAQVAFEVPYEHLVVGVGEQSATFGTPGVAENCFFIKEVSDCVRLRNRIQQQFEQAEFMVDDEARRNALRFVVVGGGPTGVEFAGTLSDFLFVDLAKRFPALLKFAQVVLIQSGSSILPVFDQALQQQALQTFERLKVEVMTNVKVTEVSKDAIKLSTGQSLGYGCVLWSTGNATRPIVNELVAQLPEQRELANPRPSSQKLAVDPWLRIIGAENAFAVGDCANIITGPLPSTAQVAGQQGAYVARTINNSSTFGKGGLDEQPPSHWVEGGKALETRHEFEFLSLGIMAYIGDNKAVVNVADVSGLNVWGNFAYLLWRSVYITKQVSIRNRILILFDWLKSRVFGRDISLF